MTHDSAPNWPRLGTHVLARHHHIDGEEFVVLFDNDTDEILRVGPREWGILAAADGTRTIEGVVCAARRHGAAVTLARAREFFGEMVDRGLVVYAEEPPPRIQPEGGAVPSGRPVVALPGYGLSCDRSGRCCRMYSTILATAAESERARAIVPERAFGRGRPQDAFAPVRGSVSGPAMAIPVRDGACGYLDADGSCAIHRRGGLEAKPAGCQIFPATFIDDGQQVRVSTKTECACVLDSAGRAGGEPLVDPAVKRAGQLPAMVVVRRLAESSRVTAGRSVPRSRVVQWVQQWLDAPAPDDVARACWAMAQQLDDRLPDAGVHRALQAWGGKAPVPSAPAVAPYIAALAKRASTRARVDARWRSGRDRVRTVGAWISMTTVVLADSALLSELLATGPDDRTREVFFVRAAAFGYGPFDPSLGTLRLGLRDLALKLWVARAMQAFSGDEADEPISALEAWLRAYGAWRYVLDV